MDFLLDHADEVLLSGLVAREARFLECRCWERIIDEVAFPAQRLMAKAIRRKVAYAYPATTRRGTSTTRRARSM